MPRPVHPRTLIAPPRLAAGFSLLEVALLVLLISAALAAGLLWLRAPAPLRQLQAQDRALQMADEAIAAYAAAYARLPCPVTEPDGDVCVAEGAKGWLPQRTLEQLQDGQQQRPLATDNQRLPPLRYIVYGGAGGTDLSIASDRYMPHRADGSAYEFGAINGLDLCAALASAASESAGGDEHRAHVLGPDGNRVNVAYGLAAAGPTAGDNGGRFDGLNQQDGPQMESPARPTGADYDDRVRVRELPALAQGLGCGLADPAARGNLMAASIDLIALGVDAAGEVAELHEASREDVDIAMVSAWISESMVAVNVVLAAANTSNASSTLAVATTQLASAVATCAIPPFVTCALIPGYAAAVVNAGVALNLAIVSTVAAAAAFGPNIAALALTIQATQLTDQPLGSTQGHLDAATADVCLVAEGGWTTRGLDENGNPIELDSPQWRDGLQQMVAEAEQALAAALGTRDAVRSQLDELERGSPSPLIRYPPMPENDGPDDPVYQQWLDERAALEQQLALKLEAVRAAETARFEYEMALQAEVEAAQGLDALLQSSVQINGQLAACDASPPADLIGSHRCANLRAAARGIDHCQFDLLRGAVQRSYRQCVPWQRQDLQLALAARGSAWRSWQQRQADAVAMAQPPLGNYIDTGGCSESVSPLRCDVLLIPDQGAADQRETYARTYFKYLGMLEAVQAAQTNLEERRQDYEKMQAQCQDLRGLAVGGLVSGNEPGLLQDPQDILRQADERGAVGSVHPAAATEEAR